MHSIDYFFQLICMWRAGVHRCAMRHIDKEWHCIDFCFVFLPNFDDNLRLVLTNATCKALQTNENNGLGSSAF